MVVRLWSDGNPRLFDQYKHIRKRGPVSTRQRNATGMAFRWWGDGDPRQFAQYKHIYVKVCQQRPLVEMLLYWCFPGGPMEARDCILAEYWSVHEELNNVSMRQEMTQINLGISLV